MYHRITCIVTLVYLVGNSLYTWLQPTLFCFQNVFWNGLESSHISWGWPLYRGNLLRIWLQPTLFLYTQNMFWNEHELSHLSCDWPIRGDDWLHISLQLTLLYIFRTCFKMDMNCHTYHAICLYIVATGSIYGCTSLDPIFRTCFGQRHEPSPISPDSFLRVYEAILANYGGNTHRYYISVLRNQGSFARMRVILHMIGHLQKQGTFA